MYLIRGCSVQIIYNQCNVDIITIIGSHNAGQEVTKVMKAIIYLTVNMFMFAEHPGIRMSDYDYDFMAEDED